MPVIPRKPDRGPAFGTKKVNRSIWGLWITIATSLAAGNGKPETTSLTLSVAREVFGEFTRDSTALITRAKGKSFNPNVLAATINQTFSYG